MRFLTILAAMVWLGGVAPAQPPAAKKKSAPPAAKTVSKGPIKSSVKSAAKAPVKGPVKSIPPKTAAKGAPVRHPATAASRGPSKAGAKSKKAVVVVRHPVQQQPTPDRYKEIQLALADKGYFRGVADGNWGPESTEALKNFQREQNLESDGKIGALSLMALGLGPKRGTASAQTFSTPNAKAEPVDPPPVAQPEQ